MFVVIGMGFCEKTERIVSLVIILEYPVLWIQKTSITGANG